MGFRSVRIIGFVVIALSGAALLTPAGAAEGRLKDPGIYTLKRIALARELINFGLEHKDPVALITAARIFRTIETVRSAPAEKTGGAPAPEGEAGPAVMSSVFDRSVTNILKRAREYAGNRKDLAGLIEDVEAMRPRGAGGLIYVDTVQAKATDTYSITYEGGKPAAIYIEGDHGKDLDISVYDSAGNKVCDESDFNAYALCEWEPKTSEKFEVRIKNPGDDGMVYILATN